MSMPHQAIRLSEQDVTAMKTLFCRHFLAGDRLWLFGSRVKPAKKGGDIDLYIETAAKTVDDAIAMKSKFLWDLVQTIGDQKIDIVLNLLNFPKELPIHQVAQMEGVRLV